jgi:hypothetical protein
VKTVDDYLSLITPWHAGRPRFRATVEGLVAPVVSLQEFIAHLPEDFDLDEAIGNQLDVVGQWVGRSRFIPVPIAGLYFTWDDPTRGWDKGIWRGPYDTQYGIIRLDDETYRRLLYAKIMTNNWDGTVAGGQAALDEFFNDPDTLVFIQDNNDMTMTIGVSQKIPSPLLLSILYKYFPLKPSAVQTYYNVTSVDQSPLFGFDVQNEYVSGWDSGAWGVTPEFITDNPPVSPPPPVATATWDPATKDATITLSNGNLSAVHNGTSAYGGAQATSSKSSGKYYFEYTVTGGISSNHQPGLIASGGVLATFPLSNHFNNGVGYDQPTGQVICDDITIGTAAASTSVGNVLGFAIDVDNKLIFVRVNGGNFNNNGAANPTTGVGGFNFSTINAPFSPAFIGFGAGDSNTVNFGASAYANAAPSGYVNWTV